MLRVIAGQYKSRRLLSPPDASRSRPYTQRLKESVFNILRERLDDANVLDLFAGVGTIGLEAVSRGARMVLMVEQDRQIYGLLQQNVEALGCQDRVDLLRGDALGSVALLRSPRPLDLVFCDPPYKLMETEAGRQRVLGQLSRVAPMLAQDALVILRTPVEAAAFDHHIDGLDGPEIRTHRRGHETLYYALPEHQADAS
ncbi:MAG: RsmD family RNA methyltransferase [Phycisphaerales bacterium]|nr:RsmD family RNA methyltransferase [Phycisphaerales bacterium]